MPGPEEHGGHHGGGGQYGDGGQKGGGIAMTVEFSMVEVNMLIEVIKVRQAAKKPVRRAKKLV